MIVLSLTDAGLAAVEGASGSDPTVIAELGLTATPFTVAPTLTALPGEFKRIAALAGTEAAPNVTHMSAYDTSGDAWNATGMGLYLDDGTLFAVFSNPTTVISKASPAFALIAFDIAFDADLAASISFGDPIFTSPPATTEMRGLVELATNAEAQAGTDVQRAITPAAAVAAVLNWIGFAPLPAASYTAADVLAKLLTVDGSGSGLDADMLDGQHGAYFADIPARLGFTPLNATAYTAADVLAKLLGVDGAGSALDADLLDGQHGAWYADIAARLGYTPLNAASYTAADVLAKLLTVDGSGSGLDADTIDGVDLGGLLQSSFFSMTGDGTSGFVSLGGFKISWNATSIAGASGSVQTVAYGGGCTYATWAKAWVEGDDGTDDVSIVVSASNLADAGVRKTTGNVCNLTLFSFGQ